MTFDQRTVMYRGARSLTRYASRPAARWGVEQTLSALLDDAERPIRVDAAMAESLHQADNVVSKFWEQDRCPLGHLFDLENTTFYIRKGRNLFRNCKTCVRERTLARYHSRRALGLSSVEANSRSK